MTLEPRAPAGGAPDPEPVALAPLDDPDRYEQLGEHARGGLGRVLRAVDKRLGRTVAVKELLRRGPLSEARFLREAMITARLQHPGIVPVHEAGRWPSGDPYYVMKLVEGRTLKELIAERATMRERLGLLPHVIAVADAVGYAHSEGVIHRDLKPANIMVGAFGETIVVDWGLARDRARDLPEPAAEPLARGTGTATPGATIDGRVIGTPAYMAPEQARGELVDERADVYALGAVLYELLAGCAPHADTTIPETPQATIDRVLAGPPRPLADVAPACPSELGTIAVKAMARAPADRYPNATALAEDLRRYQTGKLVSAHSYSTWALLRKKLAQHRGVVAVAVASALALGVVGVESVRRVVHERNIAESERGRTEAALAQAEKRKGELVLLQAITALRKDPTATLAWLKTYQIDDGDREALVNVVDEALALGVARHVFRPGDWVLDAVFVPDGHTVVAAVRDGIVRAYDLRTGHARELGTAPSALESLALTPDGAAVVTAGTMGEVMLWPLAGGAPRTLLAGTGQVAAGLRFSPDGARVLVEREKGAFEAVSLAPGGAVTQLGPKTALRAEVADRDWTRQVVATTPNTLVALDGGSPRTLGTTPRVIEAIGVSPAGDVVLVHDGEIVWQVPFAGGPMTRLAPYAAKLLRFAWSPDQRQVALVGHAHDVTLVTLAGHQVRELRGHTDALYTLEWSRDGQRLLTASDDGTARVWTLTDGSSLVLRGHDDDVYRARFSPDERQVVTASLDGSLRIWDVGATRARPLAEREGIEGLTLDGRFAVVRTAHAVARWDLDAGTREPLFAWAAEPGSLGIGLPSEDGALLLVPHPDWSMELRRRGAPPLPLVGHTALITRAAFTRDQRFLYTSSIDGTLRRWDTTTGAATVLIRGSVPIRGLAVARDGRVGAQVGDEARLLAPDGTSTTLGRGGRWCIATAEFDAVGDRLLIHRCDRSQAVYADGQLIELAGSYAAGRIVPSADGTRLAAANGDRTVRVWDARTGAEVAVLRGHTDLVLDVAFSPDGRRLASSSYDRTIRVWDLAAGRHRVLRGHAAGIDTVRWRDVHHLVSGARDGTLRVWDAPGLELPTASALRAELAAATSATITRDRPTTRDAVAAPL